MNRDLKKKKTKEMLTERPKGDTAILTNHICFEPAVTDGALRGRAAGRDVPHGRTGQQREKGPLRTALAGASGAVSVPGPVPQPPTAAPARPRPPAPRVKQEVTEQAATAATSMKSQDVKLPRGTLRSPLRSAHSTVNSVSEKN